MIKSLASFIPMDRRYALARQQELPSRAEGAVLFADISGFTPLTQALANELGMQRGPEELTRTLNQVYNTLVAEIHRYGGSVIGFSGDAITCWLDDPYGLRATACGLAVQEAMGRVANVITPAGSYHRLAVKVAVVTGQVRRFVVGDPSIQLIDVIAGSTLDDVAAAEQLAQPNEVIVCDAIASLASDPVLIDSWRLSPGTGKRLGLVQGLASPVEAKPWPKAPALDEASARPWVLHPIFEQLQQGREGFMADLRPVVPMFIRFAGIDYDGDDHAGIKLDAYIRWVQTVTGEYEGYLLQLTMGDKGSYMMLGFGAPIAHDDDPARAIAAALRVQAMPSDLDYITNVQIGITSGQVRAGTYGANARRTYGTQGNEVNMAARLMTKAEPGTIMVSQRVARRAGHRFRFQSLGDIEVKGSARPIPVAQVLGEAGPAAQHLSALFDSPLVGREDLIETLNQYLLAAQEGEGQVVGLEGPAGIGKSHLAATFTKNAEAHGWRLIAGACQSTTQHATYAPWRQILPSLLDLREDSGDNQVLSLEEQVHRQVKRLDPEWLLRLPLLGELLGLSIPENATTAGFEPRVRQEVLFSLVVDIVQTKAQQQPLLLLLEDAHWLDENSAELFTAVARGLSHIQALALITHRPPVNEQEDLLPELKHLPYYHLLKLDELSPAGVDALLSHRLQGPVDSLALSLAQAITQGNPFYVNELLDALLETGQLRREAEGPWQLSSALDSGLQQAGCVAQVDGQRVVAHADRLHAASLGLPDSVQGVVLSRIDRLPENQKLTLKVGSVIGRSFELRQLQGVHPARPAESELLQQFDALIARDFVSLETPEPNRSYIFRHHITQEVTYSSLLFGQRRRLHRAVGEWYERSGGDLVLDDLTLESPLAAHYPLLAYHWHYAENRERERIYAGLAGEQAAGQYANEEAVRFLSRALELTPEAELDPRYRLLLRREAVYEWQGRRHRQAEDLDNLSLLAAAMQSPEVSIEITLRRASYSRLTGDFEAGLARALDGLEQAQAAGDLTGQIRSRSMMGWVMFRMGQYQQAEEEMTLAVAMAEDLPGQPNVAQNLYSLGHVHLARGQYQAAESYYRRAQAEFQRTADRKGEINCLLMFGAIRRRAGNYEVALEHYERALHLGRPLGWRHGENQVLINTGNTYFDLGDYESARVHHEQALEISREVGYREGEGLSLDTLGLIMHHTGNPAESIALLRQALDIQEQIGDRRGQGYTLTHLGLAQLDMGHLENAGRSLTRALDIRSQVSASSGAVVDDLVGLAQAALAQGDPDAAQAKAHEAMQWMDTGGTDDVEFPVQAYLACYQVLSAVTGDASNNRALSHQALETGYRLVQERAANIQSPDLRRKFLEDVPFNRAVVAAWKAISAASQA